MGPRCTSSTERHTPTSARATMGAGGTYTINLPAGSYKLYVEPNTPGFSDQWWGGRTTRAPPWSRSAPPPPRTSPWSAPGWSPCRASSGRATGPPSTGPRCTSSTERRTPTSARATMGAGGTYTITLPAGSYKLYVEPNTAGFSDQWWGGSNYASATVVTVSAATTQDITLVGARLVTLSGIVQESDGTPLNGTQVYVFDGTTDTYIGAATMGAGGTYTINLPAGTLQALRRAQHPGLLRPVVGRIELCERHRGHGQRRHHPGHHPGRRPAGHPVGHRARTSDGTPLNGTQVYVFDGTTYTYTGPPRWARAGPTRSPSPRAATSSTSSPTPRASPTSGGGIELRQRHRGHGQRRHHPGHHPDSLTRSRHGYGHSRPPARRPLATELWLRQGLHDQVQAVVPGHPGC